MEENNEKINFLKEFWRLKIMVTPLVILWIYRILVVFTIIGITVTCFSAGIGGIIAWLIVLPISLLITRIYIEFVVLAFNIYKSLQEIAKNTKK